MALLIFPEVCFNQSAENPSKPRWFFLERGYQSYEKTRNRWLKSLFHITFYFCVFNLCTVACTVSAMLLNAMD